MLEARDGDEVRPDRVLIAPGGFQMTFVKQGSKMSVSVKEAPPVNRHCPSVDVLFDSVAKEMGADAVGVILTGMGSDGAKGMLTMHQAGCYTIAQSEETCVVFGMPKEAIRLGGTDDVCDLDEIPNRLTSRMNNKVAS